MPRALPKTKRPWHLYFRIPQESVGEHNKSECRDIILVLPAHLDSTAASAKPSHHFKCYGITRQPTFSYFILSLEACSKNNHLKEGSCHFVVGDRYKEGYRYEENYGHGCVGDDHPRNTSAEHGEACGGGLLGENLI